jgi:hypothetical protein
MPSSRIYAYLQIRHVVYFLPKITDVITDVQAMSCLNIFIRNGNSIDTNVCHLQGHVVIY